VNVELTQGKFAVVDDEDAHLVIDRKWQARRSNAGVWYARSSLGRSGSVSMHELIMGPALGQLVDHRDGDGLNNRRSNLRLASHQQNTTNRHLFACKAEYKGVEPADSISTPWKAVITFCGVTRTVGAFTEKWQAALAYDMAAIRLHGDFAATNMPRELVSEIMRMHDTITTASPHGLEHVRPPRLTVPVANGDRLGNLTFISEHPAPEGRSRREAFALWLCDCGNQKVIRVRCVLSGNTRACGCKRVVGVRKLSARDEKGDNAK
jgi:hypothetical protein